MPKALSLKRRIILILIAATIIIAMAACDTKTDPPAGDSGSQPGASDTPDAPVADETPLIGDTDALWERLDGYWTSENRLFVGFIKEGSVNLFDYGLFQTEYWIRGDITGADVTGEYTAAITMHIPAVEASEMFDASPERTETFYLDISGLDADDTIKVKIENLGDGGWYIYTRGGATLEEAFGGGAYYPDDLAAAISSIPGIGALDDIFTLFDGYWITTTSDYPFVGFSINESGAHEFEFGLFQTSWGRRGEITDGYSTGMYEATLTVRVYAVPADEMGPGLPESTQIIHLDAGGFYQDGTIKIKIDDLFELDTDDGLKDNSQWFTYTPGGATLDEAFQLWYVA